MNDAEELTYEVSPQEAGQRADRLLAAVHADVSRSRIQKVFEAGAVWCESIAIRKSQKVRAGDVLSYRFPEARPLDLQPADIPLRLLHEDDDLLIIDKPAGMVVHPGAGTGGDTLVHALLHRYGGKLSALGGAERPGIVHRLDKETTGVICVAKSDRAFLGLNLAFAERRVQKRYTCLAFGLPELLSGRIEQPIGRHATQRQKMTIRRDGRPSTTDWRLRESFGRAASWLDVEIHTGRTHQIRVHLAHERLPILGDVLYGFPAAQWTGPQIPRVMLHAAHLALLHPVTREPLEVTAPLPGDFSRLLVQLREQFDGHTPA